MLSGDAAPAVAVVAAQAGIAHWTAQATPEAKAARIEALRAAGRRPLMVGDGINDAAALALAHVAALPGRRQDLAQAAAESCCGRKGWARCPGRSAPPAGRSAWRSRTSPSRWPTTWWRCRWRIGRLITRCSGAGHVLLLPHRDRNALRAGKEAA